MVIAARCSSEPFRSVLRRCTADVEVLSLRKLSHSAHSKRRHHVADIHHASAIPSTSATASASTSRYKIDPPFGGLPPAHAGRPFATSARASETTIRSRDVSAPAYNLRLTPRAARDDESIQEWLSAAFPKLPFPIDVALQMITHTSWDHGVYAGHNRRLSFIGRRAMKFYLTLFLSKYGQSDAQLTTSYINDILHTSKLGESVGAALNLNEIMRWTPAVSDGQQGAKETGLYKIRGATVEAMLGAIYHQHGAQAARAFFSSSILPALNTFSPQEVEQLRGGIDAEVQEGRDFLLALPDAYATPSPQVASSVDTISSSLEQESGNRGEATRATTLATGQSASPRLGTLRGSTAAHTARRRRPSNLPMEDGPSSTNSKDDRFTV